MKARRERLVGALSVGIWGWQWSLNKGEKGEARWDPGYRERGE